MVEIIKIDPRVAVAVIINVFLGRNIHLFETVVFDNFLISCIFHLFIVVFIHAYAFYWTFNFCVGCH